MKAVRFSTLLLLPMLMALAACQTKLSTTVSGPVTTSLEMNSVTIIDRDLQQIRVTPFTKQQYRYGKVAVESMGMAPTPTGTQEVWATFTNLTDYPQTLQVRARFYDKDKRPVEEYSAWKRLTLPGKGNDTFKTMSISNQAAYFYVEAKEAQ